MISRARLLHPTTEQALAALSRHRGARAIQQAKHEKEIKSIRQAHKKEIDDLKELVGVDTENMLFNLRTFQIQEKKCLKRDHIQTYQMLIYQYETEITALKVSKAESKKFFQRKLDEKDQLIAELKAQLSACKCSSDNEQA